MYLILGERVILGIDGFIRDPIMGSQIRFWCFGLNLWYATGDRDKDGNGFSFTLEMPRITEII